MTDQTKLLLVPPPMPWQTRTGEWSGFTADQIDARDAIWIERLRSVMQPPGWKLVPVEPTPEMERAGGHVNSEWLNDNAPLGEARYTVPMKQVWAAMLAAASEPTQTGGGT